MGHGERATGRGDVLLHRDRAQRHHIEFPGNIGQTKSITDIVNGLDGKLRLQLKEGAEYPSHLDVFGIKAKGYEEAVALVQAVGDPVVRRFNDKRPFVEIHFRNRVEIELTAPRLDHARENLIPFRDRNARSRPARNRH